MFSKNSLAMPLNIEAKANRIPLLASLRYRIIISIVVIEVVMLSVMVWANTSEASKTHAARLVESASIILQQFANTVGRYIIEADYASLEEYAEAVLKHDELTYIIVEDFTGSVILAVGSRPDPQDLEELPVEASAGTYNVSRPIDFVGKPRGLVRMGFSLATVELITRQALTRGVLIASIEVILSLIAAFFVGYLLTRNLASLSQAVERFRTGHSLVTAPVRSRDEVGQLASAFNKMVVDRVKAEQALSALNEELELRVEQRTAELARAQKELLRKERLATLGQLTATVSHELRNPLGALRSSVAAIKKLVTDADKPQLSRSLDLADRSITRCDNIVADLLDYTRSAVLAPEPTRVDNWLEGILEEYAPPDGIDLRRDLRAGVEVTFDRDRLRRVIVNLMDNACHSMMDEATREVAQPEQRMTVTTRTADGRLMISVQDTGCGIPPGDLERIFEPLYSTKVYGVGLGLPIVKRIVEQHGGELEISSTVGQGTRVDLLLPLQPNAEGAA